MNVFLSTKDDIYKYEFQKKCYEEYPYSSRETNNINIISNSTIIDINNNNLSKPICDIENPFEMIYTQECVKTCEIKFIIDKSCVLNYKNNDKEKKIQVMRISLKFII